MSGSNTSEQPSELYEQMESGGKTMNETPSDDIYCNSPVTAEKDILKENKLADTKSKFKPEHKSSSFSGRSHTKKREHQQVEMKTYDQDRSFSLNTAKNDESEEFYSGLDPTQVDPTDLYEAQTNAEGQKQNIKSVKSFHKPPERYVQHGKQSKEPNPKERSLETLHVLKSNKESNGTKKYTAGKRNTLKKVLQNKNYQQICAVICIMVGALFIGIVGSLITATIIKDSIQEPNNEKLIIPNYNFNSSNNITHHT